MAERVVDLLEAVEVDHHDGTVAVGPGQTGGERDLEAQTVRQPGECVIAGLHLQPVNEIVVRQSSTQRVGQRTEESQFVNSELAAHAESVGDEQHPDLLGLAQHRCGDQFACTQTAQEFNGSGTRIGQIDLGLGAAVEQADQKSGDRFRIEILERVIPQDPQRRIVGVAAEHEQASGSRSHDRHQLGEADVERALTALVRQRGGEGVQLLQIAKPL